MKSLFSTAMMFGLLVVSSLLASDEKEKAIQADRKQIEGTWQIIALEVNGNKASEADAKRLIVVNGNDGTWKLSHDGKEISRGTSTFDPLQKPKTIDFTITEGESKGQSFLGIYEFGGKTRKLCFAPPGKPRPTQFVSEAGSEHALVTFEKQ